MYGGGDRRKEEGECGCRKSVGGEGAVEKMSLVDDYRVPRNFKLLDELEKAEKGNHSGPHASWISLGVEGDDILLSDWNAVIIGPQNTPLGDRMYNCKVHAGQNYPDAAPTVKFVQRVNMPCVDANGYVTNKLPAIQNWHRSMTIFELLSAVREAMKGAASWPQPPPESCY